RRGLPRRAARPRAPTPRPQVVRARAGSAAAPRAGGSHSAGQASARTPLRRSPRRHRRPRQNVEARPSREGPARGRRPLARPRHRESRAQRRGEVIMQGTVDIVADVAAFDEGRLGHAVAVVDWLRNEVADGRPLPVGEARMVVASLRAEMRAAAPRVPLASPGADTSFQAVQATNVAVLAMATGAVLRFDDDALARIGLAALLHDCG